MSGGNHGLKSRFHQMSPLPLYILFFKNTIGREI
jgi:hypothetical protein